MAAVCPECENRLDINTDEVEEGETMHCDECGTTIEIVSVEPLEIVAVDEGGYDDEEDSAPAAEEDDE